MTTANKLTMARFALIPVFLLVLYLNFPGSYYAAFAVFALACLTDLADGYVARKYDQASDFGKFMDPLADKVLVVAAMCWFVEHGQMPGWALAVVLLREFAVSGLRMVAVEQGRVIAAGRSGKVKTAVTMVALCAMMLLRDVSFYPAVCTVCTALIVLTTVYSGAEYFRKNRDVFRGVW